MIVLKLMYLLLVVIEIFRDGNSENRQNQNGCILPPHPSSGGWSIVNPEAEFTRGLQVPPNTILEIHCNETYKLDGPEVSACLGGIWKPAIGNCLKICPSIYSTSTMTVTCTYKERESKNCIDAVEGTIARFECASFYIDAPFDKAPAVCSNGKWTEQIPDCKPVCGKTSLQHDPAIAGGEPVKRGQFPWQVALFRANDTFLLCGGSLLTERVVVTAAHCITNEKSNKYPKENYIVVVGNYFREYNHSSDAGYMQNSSIYEMFVPEEYDGYVLDYESDIAVIVTYITFRLTWSVQPVCINWSKNAHFIGEQGYITGWGLTNENGRISMELRYLEVPIISRQQCKRNLPEDFLKYLTLDKICAGYKNMSKSICRGDSGGGLVFKKETRFYIAGVASIATNARDQVKFCDSNQYGLYTNFYVHEEFILKILAQLKLSRINNEDTGSTQTRPSSTTTTEPVTVTAIPETTPHFDSSGCILPQHPEFGRWFTVAASPDLSPGKFVPSDTVLKLHCNQGHKLKGTDLITCLSGNWSSSFGKCSKLCPPINARKNMDLVCRDEGEIPISCRDSTDGTTAEYRCDSFYESDQLETGFPIVCLDGSWTRPLPKCVPVCGKIKPASIPLIVGGTDASSENFPWHVSIYVDKSLKCAGSLISKRVVLTAAHCITDELGTLLPKKNFTLVAGHHYRTFPDVRDSMKSQFAEIQAMFIPRQYGSIIKNYFGDIALIRTKQPFRLSTEVMPVCLNWKKNLLNNVCNQKASISSWGVSSDVLKKTDVQLIPFDECPEDFQIYRTADKMCGANFETGTLVCKGDEGGGLFYNHNGRFYIVGLLTIGPVSNNETCGAAKFTLYTRLNYYIDSFILPKVIQS